MATSRENPKAVRGIGLQTGFGAKEQEPLVLSERGLSLGHDFIKQNTREARVSSNEAGCNIKVLEFQLVLRDCERCNHLMPTFIYDYTQETMKDCTIRCGPEGT
jgi:hypothetical protein